MKLIKVKKLVNTGTYIAIHEWIPELMFFGETEEAAIKNAEVTIDFWDKQGEAFQNALLFGLDNDIDDAWKK